MAVEEEAAGLVVEVATGEGTKCLHPGKELKN
jgi:hypothetical protein